jgi:hypothetical protein
MAVRYGEWPVNVMAGLDREERVSYILGIRENAISSYEGGRPAGKKRA